MTAGSRVLLTKHPRQSSFSGHDRLMIKAFIDCNILLDWLLDREPFSSYSAKVVELTETKKILGLVSPPTLAKSCYLPSRKRENWIRRCQEVRSKRIVGRGGFSDGSVRKSLTQPPSSA